jgi:hypothetical protein
MNNMVRWFLIFMAVLILGVAATLFLFIPAESLVIKLLYGEM